MNWLSDWILTSCQPHRVDSGITMNWLSDWILTSCQPLSETTDWLVSTHSDPEEVLSWVKSRIGSVSRDTAIGAATNTADGSICPLVPIANEPASTVLMRQLQVCLPRCVPNDAVRCPRLVTEPCPYDQWGFGLRNVLVVSEP